MKIQNLKPFDKCTFYGLKIPLFQNVFSSLRSGIQVPSLLKTFWVCLWWEDYENWVVFDLFEKGITFITNRKIKMIRSTGGGIFFFNFYTYWKWLSFQREPSWSRFFTLKCPCMVFKNVFLWSLCYFSERLWKKLRINVKETR